MKLSVVIPVYKDLEYLKRCLQAISSSKAECEYQTEVIIVDDDSPNWHSIKTLVQSYKYFFYKLKENSGPAEARNFGVSKSDGDIIFFIDADVVIQKETLQKVGDFFNSKGDLYSALIGSYCTKVETNDFASNFKNLMHHFVHQTSSVNAPHFWTGCGAVKKNDFEKINGFDTTYKAAIIEDVEFGYRLKKSNKNIYLDKSLQVMHLKKYNLRNLFKSDFFNRAIPLSRLILRNKKLYNDQDTPIKARLSTISVYLIIILLIGVLLMKAKLWLFVAILMIFFVVLLNYKFLYLTIKEKHLGFGLKTLAYLHFYYFYCGLAVTLTLLEHFHIIKLRV